MKNFKVTKENIEEAIEILNENNKEYNLQRLSEDVCETWGGVVIEGVGSLEDAFYEYVPNDNLPDDFDFKKHNKEFLKACGFTEFDSPLSFPWGGNGEITWLTNFKNGDELLKWCKEQHV